MSTPANFNGAKPVIDPDNAAMLFIDHQSGLFQTVKDMPMTELRAKATTLAKVATPAKMPLITTASVPKAPNGPLIPEIHKFAPHANYVAHRGEMNAWDNPSWLCRTRPGPCASSLVSTAIIKARRRRSRRSISGT
jgi:nicotinamidase-related amidase